MPGPPQRARDNCLTLDVNRDRVRLRFEDQDYTSPGRIQFSKLLQARAGSPEDYGQLLFRCVMRKSRDKGSQRQGTDFGYRKAMESTGRKLEQLELIDPGDPRIRGLGWEYLTDEDGYPLTVDESRPFFRSVGSQDVEPVDPPIRILVAIGNPTTLGQPGNSILQSLAPIDAPRERSILEGALDRLRDASLVEYKILDRSDGNAGHHRPDQ